MTLRVPKHIRFRSMFLVCFLRLVDRWACREIQIALKVQTESFTLAAESPLCLRLVLSTAYVSVTASGGALISRSLPSWEKGQRVANRDWMSTVYRALPLSPALHKCI